MSSHKPRRKRKPDEIPSVSHGGSVVTLADGSKAPAFPLVSFLWPARGRVSQWTVLPLILLAAGLFRWTTSLWPYSGYQSPPMHGDFEAQRHWMEITTKLPSSRWYFYDLEWWGLDYPPLTAYHSWILGSIGDYINPTWFALDKSRKLDSADLKVYMRATVLVSEYLIYIPAVVILLRRLARQQGVTVWESSIALVAVLMQPATILIDHGHFQYNTVMLGFTALALSSLTNGSPLWACVFFVNALGFKQMALFYAPAIFAYLLGICVKPKVNIGLFLKIAVTTAVSFALLYAPFLSGILYDWWRGHITNINQDKPPLFEGLQTVLPGFALSDTVLYTVLLQLTQSIHRVFPFARGLFEDKVANLWCALNTFHKLQRYSSAMLQRAALLTTGAAITPPCMVIFLRPRKELIFHTFAAVSWAFFLCSYQVHEKNVLLPLLPMTLLLGTHDGLLPAVRAWVGFANILGCWTMYPLLKRDGLVIPYYVITLLWAYLMGLPPTSLAVYSRHEGRGSVDWFATILHLSAYAAMMLWHVVEAFVTTPKDKPDLWVVANVIIGAGGFGLCYVWCVGQLILKSALVANVSAGPMEKKLQ